MLGQKEIFKTLYRKERKEMQIIFSLYKPFYLSVSLFHKTFFKHYTNSIVLLYLITLSSTMSLNFVLLFQNVFQKLYFVIVHVRKKYFKILQRVEIKRNVEFISLCKSFYFNVSLFQKIFLINFINAILFLCLIHLFL